MPPCPTIASDGTFSTTLYGNDVITPSNTYYMVELSHGGKRAWTGSFLITPTFNLNSASPMSSAPVAAAASYVRTNPSGGGDQTIAGSLALSGQLPASTQLKVTAASGQTADTFVCRGKVGTACNPPGWMSHLSY